MAAHAFGSWMTDMPVHLPMHKLDGRGPDAEQNHHQHEDFLEPAWSGEPVTRAEWAAWCARCHRAALRRSWPWYTCAMSSSYWISGLSIGRSSASCMTELG